MIEISFKIINLSFKKLFFLYKYLVLKTWTKADLNLLIKSIAIVSFVRGTNKENKNKNNKNKAKVIQKQ